MTINRSFDYIGSVSETNNERYEMKNQLGLDRRYANSISSSNNPLTSIRTSGNQGIFFGFSP